MGQLRTDPANEASLISFSYQKQYTQSQKAETLLLSLCRQLLSTRPSLYKHTAPLCKWLLKQSLLTLESMWVLFRSLLACHTDQAIFCFITGINDDNHIWQQLMTEVTALSTPEEAPVKFVLASHVTADFRLTIDGEKCFTLDLESQPPMKLAVKNSVRNLLRQKAQHSVMWTDHETVIMNKLFEEKAESSYFIAVQKLKLLEKPTCRSSEQIISSSLDLSLRPRSLDHLYNYSLRLIREWESRALVFVVSAVRPIKVGELAVLLAVDTEEVEDLKSLNKHIPRDVIRDLSGAYGIDHLIKVIDNRVYPVHGTLTDYMRILPQNLLRLHFASLNACLTYLKLFHQSLVDEHGETWADHISTLDSIRTYKNPEYRLLTYSTLYWFEHYRQCEDHSDPKDLVLGFLRNSSLLSTWISLFSQFSKQNTINFGQRCTPLTVASALGLVPIVKHFLTEEEIQMTDTQWDDALKLAARNGSVTVVNALLGHAKAADDALGFAAERGHKKLVDQLLSTAPGISLEKPDDLGFTPLLRAIRGGHLNVVDRLLGEGASAKCASLDDSTALHLATRLGQMSMIRRLLQHEHDLDIQAKDKEGYDCLKIAAESGFQEIVQLLLDQGGTDLINEPLGTTDRSPLCLAVTHGHYETAKTLLLAGANPRPGHGTISSPLYLASKEGFVRIVQLLLTEDSHHINGQTAAISPASGNLGHTPDEDTSGQTGEDNPSLLSNDNDNSQSNSTNPSSNINGPTATRFPTQELDVCLRVASQKGHHEIVALLLKQGIDHENRGENGETPLHLAASEGHYQIVGELLNNNFQADSENAASLTPLQLASQSGHLKAVEILIQHKVDVNKNAVPAESAIPSLMPLELAAESGHIKVTELLLSNGARATRKALELAATNGHVGVLKVLIKPREGREPLDDDTIISATVIAVEKGYNAMVNKLLTENMVQKLFSPGERQYLLHKAAEKGHDAVIRTLVHKGFPCDELDDAKQSALHIAVKNEKLCAIDALLELGKDPDIYNGDEETPLYCASKEGKLQIVKKLVDGGAKLNLLGGQALTRSTALYRACLRGHVEVVQCLLGYGADPTIRGSRGWTTLHTVSKKEVAEVLLDKHPELLHMTNTYGSTPLVIAAQDGHDDVVALFLERGANAWLQNESGSSSIHRAAAAGHFKVIKLLVEHKKGVNPNMKKKNGATALHMAAFYGRAEVVKYLMDKVDDINADSAEYGSPLSAAAISAGNNISRLHPHPSKWFHVCEILIDRGADVNSRGGPYHSPLQAAAQFGHLELARLLFDKGADQNITGSQHGTALNAAILGEHEEVIELLLDKGADPNMAVDGTPPLQAAIETGDVNIVKILLKSGRGHRVNPDIAFKDDETAIWVAAQKGMRAVVEGLIEAGASLSGNTRPGKTLMTYAMGLNNKAVVEYLLSVAKDRNIDINEKNGAGQAPIHLAVQKGCPGWVKMLWEQGANLDVKDSMGRTPLILAIGKASRDVINELLEDGADPGKLDHLGRDALYWACLCLDGNGIEQISEKLRSRDDWKDRCSRALHAAIATNKGEIVNSFLMTQDVGPSLVPDRDGWTPKYTAERCGYTDIKQLLESSCKDAKGNEIHPSIQVKTC
jgi:ankyrin repeat protein